LCPFKRERHAGWKRHRHRNSEQPWRAGCTALNRTPKVNGRSGRRKQRWKRNSRARELRIEGSSFGRRSVESQQPRRTYTLSPEAAEAVERHRERAQPDIIDQIREAMREDGVRDRDMPSHAHLEAQLQNLRAKIAKQRLSSYAYEPLSEAQQLAREWQAMQRSQERGMGRGR
jgi:hypothetical protein